MVVGEEPHHRLAVNPNVAVKRCPMKKIAVTILLFALVLSVAARSGGLPVAEAEDITLPDVLPAAAQGDEGGPAIIHGEVAYTNPFFTDGVAQPLILLEDQAGFVARDRKYVIPIEAQVLGKITSDFYTSPFTYSLTLPVVPQGELNDVDNDGEEDTGVMVFAVTYWDNVFEGPYLEERDLGGGGWSTSYASTRVSEDYETEREIIGGKLIVYAPDDEQAFPIGFGEDGLLFTKDDPTAPIPAGYTVVDLDSEPFEFNRDRVQRIDLIEAEGAALEDFSEMSYTEAFDAMVELFSREYAFTEYKNIDWDALHAEYRPRFEQADEDNDALEYRRALRDFLAEIPDGHVAGPFVPEDFQAAAGGGLGMGVSEVDTGEIYVTFLLPGAPAARAGIELQAEILEINGQPVQEHIDATDPNLIGPSSTDHNRRLAQIALAFRFPPGQTVSVTYQNPGESSPETVELPTVPELDSLFTMLFPAQQTAFTLPVEYEMLPNGYAYVKINTFFDNKLLTIQLWDRLMQALNENNVPGVIIDIRENGGGWGYIADQMAAYFFDERIVTGRSGRYNESLGDFFFDPETEEELIPPAEELRYDGEVVAIVGPNCASACEFFAYNLTLQDRATIVGHYPTAGPGGGVEDIAMPEGEMVRFTVARAVDVDNNIHIEGIGVEPDVRVPVTVESLFGEGDVLLEAAIEVLEGN